VFHFGRECTFSGTNARRVLLPQSSPPSSAIAPPPPIFSVDCGRFNCALVKDERKVIRESFDGMQVTKIAVPYSCQQTTHGEKGTSEGKEM